MRFEAGTLIPWRPGPAVTSPEFLKKNRLQEPGNVGMKGVYRFSGVCVCVCVCAHARMPRRKKSYHFRLLNLLFTLHGILFPSNCSRCEVLSFGLSVSDPPI